MEIGIFTKSWRGLPLSQTVENISRLGISHAQLNLACAGLETLPTSYKTAEIMKIKRVFSDRGVKVDALSGTFNIIEKDTDAFERFAQLCEICDIMEAPLITLCTGSRSRNSMWEYHPDNESDAAWRDMKNAVERMLEPAGRHGIVLGVEPEITNVVNSAVKARRLLDEMGSDGLKIVLDGANLIPEGRYEEQAELMTQAAGLLGRDIVSAHAKDFTAERDSKISYCAAGKGMLRWELYIELLKQQGYDGVLMLHGLSGEEAAQSIEFLRARI